MADDNASPDCHHILEKVMRGTGAVHSTGPLLPEETVCVGPYRFPVEMTPFDLLDPEGRFYLSECKVPSYNPQNADVGCSMDYELGGLLLFFFNDEQTQLRKVSLSAHSLD